MKNLLIVEDDNILRSQLKMFLEGSFFNIIEAKDLDVAKDVVDNSKNEISLCLLDINLPSGNGMTLLSSLKEKGIKVIITTVKDDEEFIVDALDNGASDYLTKPFNLKVLKARINAVLRDTNSTKNNVVTYKEYRVDNNLNVIFYRGEAIELSSKEYKILKTFLENPHRIFTRDLLLSKFWDESDNFVNDNTLTVTIKRIREKIDKESITTIRGIGYRLD